MYDPRDPFGELRALAEQAGASVVGELAQRLERPIAGTFMGAGKVGELKAMCDELSASTIIFDHDLSPRQISNIEKATLRKVVDRSELILDIFAGRATTAEAKLQVELAQLEYTAPRLRAMWSHLERISGGVGSRGPGEMQIEIDRRLVNDRKVALRRELEHIQARRKREVQARKRENFTVGIVGYTNAGKSTLFNTLTAGGAYADDRLFATLMTRTRAWDLGAGVSVLLSDTVGFVRDIPHHLVASFKATLEEATHADLLLIVLDVSDPACELHAKAVKTTLDELTDSSTEPAPRITLLNKSDRLKDNAELLVWQRRVPEAISVIARPMPNGIMHTGIEELTARVRALATGSVHEYVLSVPLDDGKAIAMIERQADVLGREYDMKANPPVVRIRARIGQRQLALLSASGMRLNLADAKGRGVPLPNAPKAGWGR
jgi:GTP-binding protein HflX